MEFTDNRRCFACGLENPIGLNLKFRLDENGQAVAKFTPRQEFQGFAGILHGGITCTLLDEAMAWAIILRGQLPVTVSLKVKFLKPVPTGEELTVIAKVIKQADKRYLLQAELRLGDGTLASEGEGTFVVVSKVQRGRYAQRVNSI